MHVFVVEPNENLHAKRTAEVQRTLGQKDARCTFFKTPKEAFDELVRLEKESKPVPQRVYANSVIGDVANFKKLQATR